LETGPDQPDRGGGFQQQ